MNKSLLPFALLCASLWIAPSVSAIAADNSAASSTPVNPVIEWNRTLLVIIRTPGAQPATLHSTRSFAMLHQAIFEAVKSSIAAHGNPAIHLPNIPPSEAPWAAAAQAARDILVALYPAQRATLDAQLLADLAVIPDSAEKSRGISSGQAAATQVQAIRSTDGSASGIAFIPGNQPGDYQLTPPNFAAADFTQWGGVRPFIVASANEFRPVPPPALTNADYTHAFNEVKELGFAASKGRSSEQTQIGQFWNGNIQEFWNEIAQTAALQRNLDLFRSAQLFAVLNYSLADTAIAFFDAKYFYHLWRPVTAVQMAATDGNPATDPDPSWLPLSTRTAPDPTYPGAHSAVSAAGAEVLRLVFGDDFRFDVTSPALPGVTRHFTTFSGAAEEAGLSRIYAGQHFRFDHNAGRTLGHEVAQAVITAVMWDTHREQP